MLITVYYTIIGFDVITLSDRTCMDYYTYKELRRVPHFVYEEFLCFTDLTPVFTLFALGDVFWEKFNITFRGKVL